MRVAVISTFAASRKEPLLAMMDRVHQGFLDAGLTPFIRFNFGDGPIIGKAVDRVLKRHPDLARFVTQAAPAPGFEGSRRISNGPVSPAGGEAVPYATLQVIAAGVPRSFPFHSIGLHFHSPEFGDVMPIPTLAAEMMAGVLITDSWWVNGRNRGLSACYVLDVETSSKKLPPPPDGLAKVLAACGKARKTIQAPLASNLGQGPVPAVRIRGGVPIPSVAPEKAVAVHELVKRFRERLPEIVKQARLPHELPEPRNVARDLTTNIGPKKPALDRVFGPMGYGCRGEAGDFVLRRRTTSNLTLELHVGIGSWGSSVLAHFTVWGLGTKALLILPPSEMALVQGQYPIADSEHWEKIVENLGALVAELERTFVPAVEQVTGPSPEWYHPER